MNDKEIREICIKTNHVLYASPIFCESYNDILRISKKRISYKRLSFPDNKVLKYWDYSQSSNDYKDNYKELCIYIRMITAPKMGVTDSGGFKVEVIYTDKTSDIFDYDGDFHFNQMDFIANLIKKLIPVGEIYSDLLDYDDLECLDYESLTRIIDILSEKPKIEWSNNDGNSDELVLLHPIYDSWVWEIFKLIGEDYQYDHIVNLIKCTKKEIKDFSFEEVRAMLTYIERGEKFCDGHIAGMIENGTLLELLKHLKKIYQRHILSNKVEYEVNVDYDLMYSEGMRLAHEAQYDEAIKLLEPVALKGNKDAQNNLGVVYQKIKNYNEAYKWYKLSDTDLSKENILRLYDFHRVEFTVEEYLNICNWFIDRDNQVGYLYLSYIYQNNVKGIEDQSRAFNVLIEGLVSCPENSRLKFEIGYLLEKGVGCKVDNVASHKCYKSILETDIVVAKYNYALQCRQGRGCKQDIKEAIKYFTIAAENSYVDAIDELIQIYSNGEYKNDELVRYWKNQLQDK